MTRNRKRYDRGFISVQPKTHRDFKQACDSKGKAMSAELEREINAWLDKQNGAG